MMGIAAALMLEPQQEVERYLTLVPAAIPSVEPLAAHLKRAVVAQEHKIIKNVTDECH